MARAKLTLRTGYHIILTVHEQGHVSIQESVLGHQRPPIVLTGKQAHSLGNWLQIKADEDATFDPVVEQEEKRRKRLERR